MALRCLLHLRGPMGGPKNPTIFGAWQSSHFTDYISLRIWSVCPKEGINPNQSYCGDGMFRPSILRIFGRGLDS